jgi:hypothetical protein
MEEKKLNPRNAGKDNKQDNKQKLTYEQLNDACAQLYQQNQVLAKQLQQANMTNMFKRLDYLFMALNYSSVINDNDFIGRCVEEIKEALTIAPAEEDKEEG